MGKTAAATARAREEAAEWFARLNRRTVTTEALYAFRAWRQSADNAKAYAEVERVWKLSGGLQGDIDIKAALEDAKTPRVRGTPGYLFGPTGRKLTLLVIALVTGAALVAAGYGFGRGSPYSTGVGEERLVRLADGSQVRLDTDSELKVRFGKADRKVELVRGRAFFEVAHDASRPFLVQAGEITVRAVGTRFDVRRFGAVTRVVLVDGRVEVRDQAPTHRAIWTLVPGQQVAAGGARIAAAPQAADVPAATSWTSGRLTFHALPLAAAVDEVNRYSPHKVELGAGAPTNEPVSGVFNTGDTDAFVGAVADLYGLRVEPLADGRIRLRR